MNLTKAFIPDFVAIKHFEFISPSAPVTSHSLVFASMLQPLFSIFCLPCWLLLLPFHLKCWAFLETSRSYVLLSKNNTKNRTAANTSQELSFCEISSSFLVCLANANKVPSPTEVSILEHGN